MTRRQGDTGNERQSAYKVSAEPKMEHVPRGKAAKAGPYRQADFVAIGGGSAGVAAAMRAASHGARVILVERDQIGGTCVNRGCIPKKMLSYGASLAAILSGCLAHTGGREDWGDAITRVTAEMARLHASYKQRLQEAGVQLLHGEASVVSPGFVQVGPETLQARRTLIATGSRPAPLPIPGGELAATSDDVFSWTGVPASLAVIGGGYIAVEMASILSRYGVKVELLVREPRLLEKFDETVANALAEALTAKGVRLHFNTDVTMLSQSNGTTEVCYRQREGADPQRVHSLRVQAVLAAVGREPVLDTLGLEALDVVKTESGNLRVDRQFRTSVRGLHAIGDIIDCPQLTPVAIAQGRWLADRLFARSSERPDFDVIPTAVFSEPAVGSVGMTEAQAVEAAGSAARIGVTLRRFVSLESRFAGSTIPSLIKIIYNARSKRVLGIHILDNAAPEIIQGMAVSIRLGLRMSHLETTVRLHPSVAEELFGPA
ncbi:dihydrolipoyl dehydrogenase family protein [Paracidovorax citrulli]